MNSLLHALSLAMKIYYSTSRKFVSHLVPTSREGEEISLRVFTFFSNDIDQKNTRKGGTRTAKRYASFPIFIEERKRKKILSIDAQNVWENSILSNASLCREIFEPVTARRNVYSCFQRPDHGFGRD